MGELFREFQTISELEELLENTSVQETLGYIEARLVNRILEAREAEKVYQEVAKHIIPPELRSKVKSEKWRKELLEKCGEKAFLRPQTLSYPVMDDNCKYNCGLLFAAYLRAASKHQYDLKEKAIKLYKQNNCEEELGLHPHDIE